MDIDLGNELGAEDEASNQRLTLYIPNKDKNDQELENQERWVNEARNLLSEIGGGATAYPPADGTWVNEDGRILWEKTRIIYCYINAEDFVAHVKDLREFVHRFGRGTNQGEVVVEFDNRFWKIRRFDPAGE